jgi:hypothetical protein
MAGFSSDWLALREPADRAARGPALLASLAAFAPSAKSLKIMDLGAGTGSTLRAVAPHLPVPQAWVLVDHDGALVETGRQLLARWAEASSGDDQPPAPSGDGLALRVGSVPVTVTWREADLAAADWPSLLDGVDLVTASALFDLVSAGFVERFADAVAAAGAAVYVALDVDGTAVWSPSHPDDDAVAAAFRRHQGIDKGFGPALGPEASRVLAEALAARGFRVETEKAPWRLGADSRDLIAALAEGWAGAARAAGLEAATVERWLAARRDATGCVIGHTDLLATPPAR